CRSLGCRLSDVGDGLFWSLDPLKLTDPAALKGLRRETERRRLDVLVIDPLYLAIVVSEGDPASIYRMGRLLVVMTKLAADTGVTPVLVHHAVKRRDSPHEPMQLHELNGAGGGEYARQWGLLSRRVPFDGENPGHHELWLTVGGSAGHSGTYAVDLDEFSPAGFRREWRASVRPASEVKAAIVADREAERETRRAAREKAAVETAITRYAPKVIEYLRKPENRTGRSASSIRNACGMDLKASRAVLPYLLDSGQMVGCRDRAANKQWYDGYRLPGWHPDASEASGSPGCHPGAADDHGTHSDEGPSLGAHPRVCASASSPRTCRRESARPKPPAAGKRGA
ncbi:MAG TPA: AAA family ATPase, partial [Planctomycetaceae bacterium]